MKTRSFLFTTLCSLMLGMNITGCSDSDEPEIIIEPVEYPNYILNEGHWGANNASISMFKHPANGLVTADAYLSTNKKQMGDVGNAMMEEDDNIYVLLNGSKYVARLDLNTKEQARYTFPEGEGEPRCMEVEDDYAYVTQYGGQVTKLSVKDMTLVGTFKGGDNLEGIVEKDGKLYVANSYKGINEYNEELFVIDAKTMTLEKTIKVALNPTKIYNIDDKIYLLSQGNYTDIPAVLQIINTATGEAKKITGTENISKITEGFNGLIYGVLSTFDEYYNPINSLFTYNPSTGAISETSFLLDAPSSFKTDAIYLLEVDEKSGFIYVGTTDYQNTGTIYAFDKTGKFFQSFDSGGINPSTMIFID